MGSRKRISGCGGSSCSSSQANSIPNPKKFKINKLIGLGELVYVEISYPDCTNFEGEKVLVFYKVAPEEILAATEIDPHFCDGRHITPIARFAPTLMGKLMGLEFAKTFSSTEN